MFIDYTYYYFKNVIPKHICDQIIKYAFSLNKPTPGLIGEPHKPKKFVRKKRLKEIKKVRDSDVIFLDVPWMSKEFLPFAYEANEKANWNFDISRFEKPQFTIYNKNQHYNWHQDNNLKDNEMKYAKGFIRKLSMSIVLSEPENYKGGDLQFDTRNSIPQKPGEKSKVITAKEALGKGTVIVFPSFVWHRVTPVLKGTRYSLVVWFTGPPFK